MAAGLADHVWTCDEIPALLGLDSGCVGRKSGVAALMGLVGLVSSCGTPDELVIVNRSDQTLAILPGIVVPPCSQAGYTASEIATAKDSFTKMFLDDDASWIPADAIQVTRGWAPQRIGAPDPQTVIISGSVDPRVIDGPVADNELPACGGAPLGVSEATPEPN
jgi:hypothetical protein